MKMDFERVSLEEVKNPERFHGNTDFLDDAIAYATDKVCTRSGRGYQDAR